MNSPTVTSEATLDLVREILQVADIRPDANFFDLGGDSLTAAFLSLLLEERLGARVDVFAIYGAEDLAEVHRAVEESLRKEPMA